MTRLDPRAIDERVGHVMIAAHSCEPLLLTAVTPFQPSSHAACDERIPRTITSEKDREKWQGVGLQGRMFRLGQSFNFLPLRQSQVILIYDFRHYKQNIGVPRVY